MEYYYLPLYHQQIQISEDKVDGVWNGVAFSFEYRKGAPKIARRLDIKLKLPSPEFIMVKR